MNNTIKKVFSTGVVLTLVGLVGFGTAFGYGGGGGGGVGSGLVQTTPATPAIPATPAVPGVTSAVRATPATPAIPRGRVLGAETFNFTKPMKRGSRGNEVTELQSFLNVSGFDCGTVDGKFGPKTKGAVVKFQIASGLKGDGIVGPLTRAVLNK